MASDGETWCANDPNFAVIYSFLKVFGKLYGIEVPTITKLQESIEDTQEVSETLKELHLRLLRRALKTVHSNRWEKGMIKFCHQQGHHQEAWEIERFSYKKASTQVKIKVMKILLEYQFTCHPKFKLAVNAIASKELRLDPIGRDQSGCAYWLQMDNDANICLYREDQDDETWQLIARNREELVKVISQLKSGEEISPSQTSNVNEDSSGAENPTHESHTKPERQSQNPEVDEDENDEEFLSPESESDQETEEQKDTPSKSVDGNETNVETSDPLDTSDVKVSSDPLNTEQNNENKADEIKDLSENQTKNTVTKKYTEITTDSDPATDNDPEITKGTATLSPESEASIKESEVVTGTSITESENKVEHTDSITENKKTDDNTSDPTSETEGKDCNPDIDELSLKETTNSPKSSESSKDSESILEEERDSTHKEDLVIEANKSENEEVSEAIEEPVMHVTGEGNGADCESYYIGEEISEPVMYIYGEGYGYDNETGNPEATEDNNQVESEVEEENGTEEVVNGEHDIVKTKSKLGKSFRLKTVNKRSLKKQSSESIDTKPDTKKPCVRDTEKSHNSKVEHYLKRESNVNDKSTTDSDNPRKNNTKKGRSKVKKKVTRKLKFKRNGGKEAINSVETDNCQNKTSIIEKRKSSVSSVDQEDNPTENEKEKTPEAEIKVEDPLPTKKIRLETTPESDVDATHSNDVASDSIENIDNGDPIAKRKKIKARKGKFKRKCSAQNNQDLDKSNNIDKVNNSPMKSIKSLKRSLIAEPVSDKNKSESQSESEDDEPITSGKRLKIKPKKIITSSRKKVEAKHLEKHSSESEEETLYSLAGKKSAKKLVKKKPKGKDMKVKAKSDKANSEDSDTPVRQSRRIAQQKIKEEAERRHQEEVALRELKLIHKKGKSKDDDEEEEWRESGRSSSEREVKPKQRRTWRASDSTGPEPDSESDSPLFELHQEPEPENDYGKSDHEFSPESDLECDESPEPLKRARTLQEEKDEGFCKKCGSGEQPEWILLCDTCDAGYHASCLKPMLFVVPEGDWHCPPCNHDKLIKALESELVKYDEILARVEEERARKKLEEPEPPPEEEKKPKSETDSDVSSDSSWSSSSGDAAVYRLRARRQLPVSVRSLEYDRIISAAIKEEYVEATTSAGNQGRGKDISTIIEAAEEEKMKAEREAIEQGKPVDLLKKLKKKQRRKPRKLNSLEVPSEDDDETDEDFKDMGGATSSEDISSSADKETSDSRSSDSMPIRRTGRTDRKERPKMTESSPETKKKKRGVFEESSSESAGAKEWNSSKPKSKGHSRHRKRDKRERRDKSKKSRSRGLTQYDAAGNVIRPRVTYGGLSGDEGENDWSPKHRTRQKKINYTEMPNTESEDEMHKSSGKHMPDSSDEFKCSDSDVDTDSDSDRTKKRREEENAEREKALADLIKKTAVVPLEKLPEDVTKAKTEELQAHLNAQAASTRPARGKGSRGGRGSRGPGSRGGARSSGARAASPQTDDALAKLVGVKIKELGQDGSPAKASQLEREKKRQEREAKLAEREAKKLERVQKREEKERMKEQKAKEREEKKLARIALQESKRVKKEKEYMGGMGGYGVPVRPLGAESPHVNNMNMFNHMRPMRPAAPPDGPDQRFPHAPRLQVRAELRGVVTGEERLHAHRAGLTREGTLSVAGSPQPFKPVSEEPSIITRMPHMLNHQFRGPMMYGGAGGPPAAGYGAGRAGQAPGYGPYPPAPHYYRLPPAYPNTTTSTPPPSHHHLYRPHLQGPGGPPASMHHNQPPLHHSGGYYRPGTPGAMHPGGPSPSPAGSPMPPGHGPHMQGHNIPGAHNMPGAPYMNRSPGPNPSPSNLQTPPNSTLCGLPPGAMPPRPGAPGGLPVRPEMSAALRTAGVLPPNAGQSAAGSSAHENEPPIRIKAEVKTEPEYRSPVASPGAASPNSEAREEPPRHPKIKVTEVRERRPRFPLGPYAPHLAPYRPYAPGPHPGPGMPGPHHPGTSGHPQGQSPYHPGLGPHHSGQPMSNQSSPVHPGMGLHRPPHPGASGHHQGQNSHAGPSATHPAQSSHQPGQSQHHSGPAQQGPSPHVVAASQHPRQSPHHPGQRPHLGPNHHQPGPGSQQQAGPSAQQPGSSQHPLSAPQHAGQSQPSQRQHAGASPHQPGLSPHQQGPSHQPGQSQPNQSQHQLGQNHSIPSPHQPGLSSHPGSSSHPSPVPNPRGQSPHPSPGQSPHHPGSASHHQSQSPHHPGPTLSHPGSGPSPHASPLLLRDPSQVKTERDASPPPNLSEDTGRTYPPVAGRGYPPASRSPYQAIPGPGYPPAGVGPYGPGGSYPPGAYGAGRGYTPGAATRGYPPGGIRPFPPQFPPRSHLPGPHLAHALSPLTAHPPPAKSPQTIPPRAPPPHSPLSQSPHSTTKPPVQQGGGRGSMPFPARTVSPNAPLFQAQSPREPPARSPSSPPYQYGDRRPPAAPPQPSASGPSSPPYPYGDRQLPVAPTRADAGASSSPPYPYGDRRPPGGPQRPPAASAGSPRRRLESLDATTSPNASSPPPLDRVKIEREEGSVFGGLVSYFSSQHEDEMEG